MRHVFGFDGRIEIERNPDPDFVLTLPPRFDGLGRRIGPKPMPQFPTNGVTGIPFPQLSFAKPSTLEILHNLLQQLADGVERAPVLSTPSLRQLRHDLAAEAERSTATLPIADRNIVASALPVLAGVDAGLAAQEREATDRATAAEGARAFAQLERLTHQGLPLEQALATADALFAALSAGGLLGALPDAARTLARERLAAAKLRARLQADPAAPIADAPEAALVSAATLEELERERQALQAERVAAGQAELLAGLADGTAALSEEQVLQVLGPVLGAKAWQTYRRRQGEAAATAGFAAVERVAPGLARLLQRPETEAFARRLAVLLQEGSAAPTPWTPAEAKQKAEAWIEIESAHPGDDAASRAQRGNAIIRFLEAHVAALPQDLQAVALAALEAQGAGAATPGALAAVAAALRDGRRIAAVELAKDVRDGAGGGHHREAAPSRSGRPRPAHPAALAPAASSSSALSPLLSPAGGDPGAALGQLLQGAADGLENFLEHNLHEVTQHAAAAPLLSLADDLRSAADQYSVAGAKGAATANPGFDVEPLPEPGLGGDFDPEEARRISRGLFGPHGWPPDISSLLETEGFTIIDFDKGSVVEVFPDQRGEIPQLIVLENSRGSDGTQQHITDVGNVALDSVEAAVSQPADEWKGGRARDTYKEEKYLRNRDTGGRLGSSRTDFSVRIPGTERWLHINTVDITAAGYATTREKNAAIRILYNMKSGDMLVLIPKLNTGESLDPAALKAFLIPLITEMAQPTWSANWTVEKYNERFLEVRPVTK